MFKNKNFTMHLNELELIKLVSVIESKDDETHQQTPKNELTHVGLCSVGTIGIRY